MAMNPNTHTVKRGDTLSEIAQQYRSAYNSANGKNLSTYQYVDVLAAINDIPNKNVIGVGDVLKLEKSSSGGTTKKKSSSKVVKKRTFGLQAGVDNTLLATWYWDKADTKNYNVQWRYRTKNKDKDGNYIWFYETKSETDYKYSTFSIPAAATRIQVRIKPLAKTEKKKDTKTKKEKEVAKWTMSWSDWGKFDFYTKDIPPSKPSQPSVSISGLKLTASLDGIASDIDQVTFYMIKNGSTKGAVSKTVSEKAGHAEHTFTVAAGNKYQVRCRLVKDGLNSEWSDYSNISDGETQPIAPKEIIKLSAKSSTEVYIDWTNVANAESYDIEYTTKKTYFDSNPSEVRSTSINAPTGHAEITNMEAGKQYFFRVRAVNQKGSSAWCPIKSIIIGTKPEPPTTWSSSTTVIVGEPLTLFWVHNSEDGSLQTRASLKLIIGNTTKEYILNKRGIYNINSSTPVGGTITPTTEFKDEDGDGEEENKTNSCIIDTTGFAEGADIQWQVSTAGITKNLSDYSTPRTVDIYTKPELQLSVTDKDGNDLDVIESFPFYVRGLPVSVINQLPIGYYLTVIPKETYESVDDLGNDVVVNEGTAIYSKHFDITDSLLVEMSPGNLDLQNGIEYTVSCTVSMDSGLTDEASVDISVSWVEEEFVPNAEIGIDTEAFYAVIRPYCEESTYEYRKVSATVNIYTVTEDTLDAVSGEEVEGVLTTTGEQVYFGISDEGEEVYYCMVTETTLVENVTLAVYRREFDGSFTEIATGLSNTDATYVTDPHPALDYARYRIIATSTITGAVSYYDLPNYPVGGTAVIIQWDEEWTDFFSYGEADDLIEPSWSGSLLKLPYNIDVSDKYSPDVALVKYIGRKRPVSYFGTQLGESSTWNVVIEKSDEETLYALRRLSIWAGNAYVREPSGTGYWAKVTVSFSQKHNDLTIPVSLDIERVEGGI